MAEYDPQLEEASGLEPQEGAQEVALGSKADVTIYGGAAGSGKSYIMLLRPLLQIEDPNFNCVFFRRTGPQLSGAGGLWSEAKKMYADWFPRIVENERKMTFPSGAVIKFSHMEHERNAIDHQGLQYSQVYFDEGTHFLESQVTYLMSRLRSDAECDSTMFVSCNPDPDSFIADWIDWWLDDSGYPDKAKCGVIRHYIVVDETPVFADTEQELVDDYRGQIYIQDNEGNEIYVPPKTMTFIGGTIFDNPALIRANPKYLAELNSLPHIEKSRLLHGNWYARPEGSSYFQRQWLQKAETVPYSAVYCRAWDKAATSPSELNTHPDYTACVKMAKCKDGNFYILGSHHPQNHDKKFPDVFGRFRETSGSRDKLILKQAVHDGSDCAVVLAQDPGSAGITEYQESAKKLITEGFTVKKDPTPAQLAKLTRYGPFASAAETGLVYIVESTFTKQSLEAFYKENEAFDGERSTKTRKDDWPDATASAFNYLCKTAVIPAFTLADFRRNDPFS